MQKYEYATWGRRFLAQFVDGVLSIAVSYGVFLGVLMVLWAAPGVYAMMLTMFALPVCMFVVPLLYFSFFESGGRRTLGKKLFRLRVLSSATGRAPGFFRAAARFFLIGVMPLLFGALVNVGLTFATLSFFKDAKEALSAQFVVYLVSIVCSVIFMLWMVSGAFRRSRKYATKWDSMTKTAVVREKIGSYEVDAYDEDSEADDGSAEAGDRYEEKLFPETENKNPTPKKKAARSI